jgi:hypothetical protein
MIYSLASRFKGALLGCLISETLENNHNNLDFSGYQPSAPFQIAIFGTKSIIDYGELNLKSWLINLSNNQVNCLKLKNTANSSQTAIASIPVALFYYQNLTNLTNNLQLAMDLWQDPDLSRENVLLWGYVIKIILDNELSPHQIISQIKAVMEKKQLSLPDILLQIDSYIQQKSPLAQLSHYLDSNYHPNLGAIAQSLYFFATIPDDFRLCLERTLQTSYQPKLTATLTATLLGLYNSDNNIPLSWRLSLKESPWGQKIETLSENLLAVWSGSYHLKKINSDQACYSPGVIQARKK